MFACDFVKLFWRIIFIHRHVDIMLYNWLICACSLSVWTSFKHQGFCPAVCELVLEVMSHPTRIRSHFFPALFQLFLSVYCYTRRLSLFCHHLVASRHAGMWLGVLGPLGQMLLPSSWPKIVKAVLLNIPKACWITVSQTHCFSFQRPGTAM